MPRPRKTPAEVSAARSEAAKKRWKRISKAKRSKLMQAISMSGTKEQRSARAKLARAARGK